MEHIRPAERRDLERIAEIAVFNYRLNFYPIFRDDGYYFQELTVSRQAPRYAPQLEHIWVYDDGVVKGFIQVEDRQVQKLFVEPVLHGNSIGAKLLEFAVRDHGAAFLWALEKNERAIAFYNRHGFHVTAQRKLEEDTAEYLIRLER